MQQVQGLSAWTNEPPSEWHVAMVFVKQRPTSYCLFTHAINAETRHGASPLFVYFGGSLYKRCMRQVVSLWNTLISNHSLVLPSCTTTLLSLFRHTRGLNNKWVHHVFSPPCHNGVYPGNVQVGAETADQKRWRIRHWKLRTLRSQCNKLQQVVLSRWSEFWYLTDINWCLRKCGDAFLLLFSFFFKQFCPY